MGPEVFSVSRLCFSRHFNAIGDTSQSYWFGNDTNWTQFPGTNRLLGKVSGVAVPEPNIA
jgi:hypothetical protein